MTSKIAILSTVNFKHMTMLSMYTDYLDKNRIPYDVIYIDKYGEAEENNAVNTYSYLLSIKREWRFIRKLIKYLGFRSFAKKIIKSEEYDFLIVWNSFTAIIFSDFLIWNYKKSYALNVRDYNYEKIPLIYYLMKLVVNSSKFTTISSEGFKEFLPRYKYLNVHSFNEKFFGEIAPREKTVPEGMPIRISFIGYVRFFENDMKLIDLLGNDKRFEVQFFGEGAMYLSEYAKDKGYNNVTCVGRFKTSDTSLFLEKTDIINNLYGFGRVELDTAISIKSFYAAYLNLPILVFKDTYMAEATKGFNYVCDLDSPAFSDNLYKWYRDLDFENLKNSCKLYIESAKHQNQNFYEVLDEVILKKKGM